jgi:hypothetical protein
MKNFLLILLLITYCNASNAQISAPPVLLDGLPSGSVYTDSVGILSLGGQTNYQILSCSMHVEGSTNNTHIGVSITDGSIGNLIRLTPSGSKVTFLVKIGCQNCVSMQVSAIYFAP